VFGRCSSSEGGLRAAGDGLGQTGRPVEAGGLRSRCQRSILLCTNAGRCLLHTFWGLHALLMSSPAKRLIVVLLLISSSRRCLSSHRWWKVSRERVGESVPRLLNSCRYCSRSRCIVAMDSAGVVSDKAGCSAWQTRPSIAAEGLLQDSAMTYLDLFRLSVRLCLLLLSRSSRASFCGMISDMFVGEVRERKTTAAGATII